MLHVRIILTVLYLIIQTSWDPYRWPEPGGKEGGRQAFSQKGVRVSCGRPILGENDEKCTKALTNL